MVHSLCCAVMVGCVGPQSPLSVTIVTPAKMLLFFIETFRLVVVSNHFDGLRNTLQLELELHG